MDDLDKMIEDMENIVDNFDEGSKKLRMNVISELSDDVVGRTPVKTGTLKNGWEYIINYKGDSSLLYNDIEYANHIEYGHRTRNGGFVEGRYMLRDGAKEAEKTLEKEGKNFMKELIGHD